MYTKIMAAVDGSSIAMGAFEEAMQLAQSQEAELMAVYVVDYPHTYISDRGYDPPQISQPLINEGKRVLEDTERLMKSRHIAFRSLLIDDRLSLDSVAQQLQKAADENEADLVVLGTHGRGGFKRLMLGSVAEGFVRLSSRPVLLVPGGKPHKEEE